jgi:two-component system, OmpR family, phosphate regulon sensor histidine kinase PhoR
LTNVLYNLLENALKYNPRGVEIEVFLEEKNDHISLIVKDNGIGIAPEYRHKIFEKFFRVPTGNLHNIKGHGLGLSYVASVVKGHKGNIEVQSELENGSAFMIQLPKKTTARS